MGWDRMGRGGVKWDAMRCDAMGYDGVKWDGLGLDGDWMEIVNLSTQTFGLNVAASLDQWVSVAPPGAEMPPSAVEWC